MRKLTETSWFKNEYVKAYDIVNVENRMPPLDEIYVLDDYDVKELQIIPRDTVMGFAFHDNGKHYVWFRHEPPGLSVFAHEMIHLAKKHKQLDDEVYAYDLTPLVTILVERNIVPKRNVLRLFEDLNLDVLSREIKQCFHVNDIEAFLSILGVIPSFATFTNGTIAIQEEYTEDEVMIGTLMELIDAAEYDDFILNFILHILNNTHPSEKNEYR